MRDTGGVAVKGTVIRQAQHCHHQYPANSEQVMGYAFIFQANVDTFLVAFIDYA